MKQRAAQALAALWERFPPQLRRRVLFATNHHFLLGVVGLVINDEGHVLVLEHRFRTPYRWGLPGGFIDYGESLAAGLRRELMEEVGLAIEAVEPAVDLELSHAGRYLSAALMARPCDPSAPLDFSLNPEILGGGFFAPDALPEGTYPYHRALIQTHRRT